MKRVARKTETINDKSSAIVIENVDTRVALIQALIPIGLECVNELLQSEVKELAGSRYSRHKPDEAENYCWGQQNRLGLSGGSKGSG